MRNPLRANVSETPFVHPYSRMASWRSRVYRGIYGTSQASDTRGIHRLHWVIDDDEAERTLRPHRARKKKTECYSIMARENVWTLSEVARRTKPPADEGEHRQRLQTGDGPFTVR